MAFCLPTQFWIAVISHGGGGIHTRVCVLVCVCVLVYLQGGSVLRAQVCVFVCRERECTSLSIQAVLHDVYMQVCFVVDSVKVVVESVRLLLFTRMWDLGLLTCQLYWK